MRHNIVVSICFMEDPCIMFLRTNPFEITGTWSPHNNVSKKQAVGFDKVNGICLSGHMIYMLKQLREENDFDISCIVIGRIIVDKNGPTIETIGFSGDIGIDAHDIVLVNKDGSIDNLLVTSTGTDHVTQADIRRNDAAFQFKPIICLGQRPTADIHHFNSLSLFGEHVYVTAAHKGHQKGRSGDAYRMLPDGSNGEWLNIEDMNKRLYLMPHNYTQIDEESYILCDSLRNRVVMKREDEYIDVNLGAWTRGLLQLPDGKFIVGVTPRREKTHINGTIPSAALALLDENMRIEEWFDLPITKDDGGNIFSIRELEL